MKATLFALSQFLHRDQMDRGRTACAARGNLDDLQRDSLSCPIRLSAQTKGLTETRVSRRHALDKLGIKPSMLEKRNRLHGLTDSGVAPQPWTSNYSASFWGRFDLNNRCGMCSAEVRGPKRPSGIASLAFRLKPRPRWRWWFHRGL